jgi:sRNA-binding regulator protein Hfq
VEGYLQDIKCGRGDKTSRWVNMGVDVRSFIEGFDSFIIELRRTYAVSHK